MAAIVTGDLSPRFSVKTGSAGNTTASSGAASLGTYISSTAWAGGTDLFDNISGAANASSQVDYRAVFLSNGNASNDYQSAVCYLSAETAGGASLTLSVDSTAASAIGSSSAQALTATTATSPGSGVTSLSYSAPTTAATGLSMGTIAVGQVRAIWIKRTAANSAALSADSGTVSFSGDTGSL